MLSRLLALTLLGCSCAAENAQRALACTYVYGGIERSVSIPPTTDPYRVPLLDVAETLGWKVVYVAAPEPLAVVSVYTYSLSDTGPVLIHQAKYRPPFPEGGGKGFTGLQMVYEPSYHGEFAYWCGWTR